MGPNLQRKRGRRFAAGGQAGFTLIELVVAMFIGVTVLTGGTLILARAFGASTQATARTQSTGQAEAGFERLILDLRYAQRCPANTPGAGSQTVDGLLISAGPTLQMCGPVPGRHNATPVPLALITWTCNTDATSQSCSRSSQAIQCGTAAATGDCSSASAPTLAGTALTSVPIAGVTALTVSGIVGGANQASLLANTACQASPTSTGIMSYGLKAGSTCPLSWIGLQAQVIPLLNAANPADATNGFLTSRGVAATSVQTGTELENYGR